MLKLALVLACCAGARKHHDGGARNGSAKIPGRWIGKQRPARQNRSRVLKVFVLGGSPAAGEGCREPLDGEDDDFAWLYDPRTSGSAATCAWPARLARYLSRVANVTALVFNMAHGGSSSETFLANGEALFRERRKRSAIRTARREPLDAPEAAARRRRRAVDRRRLRHGRTLPDAHEDALADARATSRGARSIDDALRRWAGFGHYAAAYHEWMAACVFYALIAPALDDDGEPGGDDDGAPGGVREAGEALRSATRRGRGDGARLRRRSREAETERWRYGEDVAGKPGWVSCNGAHEIAFDVVCDRATSSSASCYDPRMGAANVTAAQAGVAVSRVVDGKDLGGSRASIFAMRALTGLAPGAARVTVTVLPRKRLPDGEPRGCASFLATTPTGGMCCLRDKFKLLSLACT
ncbi:hypothetical protein JL720_534 [Aureococcus anophagefferens]|nr:hypothetical protein JL720_534 [Aureococcus anophagefferens]